jgi:3-ketosteroid 9alpha-monooxygenase subunit A
VRTGDLDRPAAGETRFPFPYPTGWFQLMWSADIAPGGVVRATAFGRHLVAWRAGNGQARVFDGYCPHLGADLACGTVTDGGLQCPYHGWTFDDTGRVADIPYRSEPPPAHAATVSHPVLERDGCLWVWYHPAGTPPSWEPPTSAGAAGDHFRTDHLTVRSSCQDVIENLFDRNHFCALHGWQKISDFSSRSDDQTLEATFVSELPTVIGAREVGQRVVAYGLGYVAFEFDSAVKLSAVLGIVPVHRDEVVLRFSWRTEETGSGRRVADFVATEVLRTLEEDVEILERKAYLTRPLLVREDGDVGHFRQWARRFYD